MQHAALGKLQAQGSVAMHSAGHVQSHAGEKRHVKKQTKESGYVRLLTNSSKTFADMEETTQYTHVVASRFHNDNHLITS